MVETISPVVYGGRTGRWAGAVALHALGATVAAAAAGLLLGAAGMAAGAPWGWAGLAATIVVALAYAARDLLGLRVPPLVEARRQVPEWWRTFFSPPVASLLYGLGLGIGFFTYLGHGTLVVVAAGAVTLGRPWLGALVMVPFGLARALAPLAAMGTRTAAGAAEAADRLEALGRTRVRPVVNGLASSMVAAAAAMALARTDPATWAVAGGSRLAPVVLGLVFAWAALAKSIRPATWRGTLAAHDLPHVAAQAAGVAVPLAEATVAVLLLGGYHRVGAIGALVLLASFTAALVRAARRDGTAVPCGCFGRDARIDARIGVLRNVALAALAAAAFAAPSPQAVSWNTWSGGGLPLALAALGVVAGTWFVASAMGAMRRGAPR